MTIANATKITSSPDTLKARHRARRTEHNVEVGQFRFEVCGWVSSVYWGDAFYTNLDACLLHVWGRESFTAGITGIVLRKPDDHR